MSANLRDAVNASLTARRPLLHHLNADTSWLLQVSQPHATTSNGSRHWYNVLIDPWLTGSQSDVASWFSQQWHAQAPIYSSIAAVEALCREVETVTTELLHQNENDGRNPQPGLDSNTKHIDASEALIDVVTISHEFTDHCHRETLLQVPKSVPVLAASKAVALIKGWKHFRTVLETPHFGGNEEDWRRTSADPLPAWISISRLVEASNALYYHSAVLITFEKQVEDGTGAAEAVVYTPHGIRAEPLKQLTTASPPISTLALLHGLHDIKISRAKQLNLGAHNGLEALRILDAKYWIGTHDEVKRGGGLISFFLRRQTISVKDALELEGSKGSEKTSKMGDAVQFLDIGNGEVRCLE